MPSSKESCLVYGLHDMRLIPIYSAEFVAGSTTIFFTP